MLGSQGNLGVFFSNPLVGTLTGASLLLLFWPLISKAIAIARGKR
jgi:TctA family transporter